MHSMYQYLHGLTESSHGGWDWWQYHCPLPVEKFSSVLSVGDRSSPEKNRGRNEKTCGYKFTADLLRILFGKCCHKRKEKNVKFISKAQNSDTFTTVTIWFVCYQNFCLLVSYYGLVSLVYNSQSKVIIKISLIITKPQNSTKISSIKPKHSTIHIHSLLQSCILTLI